MYLGPPRHERNDPRLTLSEVEGQKKNIEERNRDEV